MKKQTRYRKTATVLSLLAASMGASAQSSVTVYGIADAGLRTTHGLTAGNAA